MRSISNRIQYVGVFIAALTFLVAGCSSTPTPTATVSPDAITTPIPPNASGYRPVQAGDLVEGVAIDFQYIYPNVDKPVVDVAFSKNLLQLIVPKSELRDGMVAYFQELASQPRQVLAYDENNPKQEEPALLTIEANKPVEYIVVAMDDKPHLWSVRETQEGEVRAAYKIIRRKDGGLRFIDAYDQVSLHSANFATTNGLGLGLVFSARMALLRTILSNQRLQRGTDVMNNPQPSLDQYDPRILKTDPKAEGLAQDVDWVLIARPGPNPGQAAP